MYAAVQAWPDGNSTVARFAAAADRFGFDGLVVRNHHDRRPPSITPDSRERSSTRVIPAIELHGESPAAMSGGVVEFRDTVPIVCLHGGTDRRNRFAVEQDRIDVLAHPFSEGGTINHILARSAAENAVHIEFNLRPVFRARGGRRVEAIRKLRTLHDVIRQYDAPYVVSSIPRDHLELRTPRACTALGSVLEIDPKWIETGLANWGRIAAKNAEIMDPTYVEPGIQILDRSKRASGDGTDDTLGQDATPDNGRTGEGR